MECEIRPILNACDIAPPNRSAWAERLCPSLPGFGGNPGGVETFENVRFLVAEQVRLVNGNFVGGHATDISFAAGD